MRRRAATEQIDPASSMDVIFKNRADEPAAEPCSGTNENTPSLKIAERPDWTLFRTIEGLQQKAGVPTAKLRRLVLKELGDNAFDAGAEVEAAQAADGTYSIADNGPGLDGTPDEIAELFSIRRPMRSSKLLRLPQRGALGNGLRVVAGAVLASEGSLAVITRNQRIVLSPQVDGSTRVVEVATIDHSIGTRVEIKFGAALPDDSNALLWVSAAKRIASAGKAYEGKSSPYWYDPVQFHELVLAHGRQPLRSLIAQLDGCSGGKAGEIVAAAGSDRLACENVTREQAAKLLEIARTQARPVSPERLGFVGRDPFCDSQYAIERGHTLVGNAMPKADIPFVVEVWARTISAKGNLSLTAMVNRTPITGEVSIYRDSEKDISLFGCGLADGVAEAPKKGAYAIVVNIITPYCPITSDGKAPNLEPFADALCNAIRVATKKAQRAAPKDKKVSQKDVVLENLDDAIAAASGDGEFRFNERQIFYQLRPIVLDETGQELLIGNFKGIITDYESENGEISGMYREPRGSIYHPHRREDMALGTLTVEDYERPIWTFNKLVYIEKEGFSEALKANGWPERHDCALTSSKGFTTRAVRDLVDNLAAHDEPVTVFCVHDADAYGTMIYQTFQEETKARGARLIQIVNIGLEPWEAVGLGFEVETVLQGEKRKAVADYVLEREDGEEWEEWLQTHRVELNAMTTPEFIEWLDDKMEAHGVGKLVPPNDVIAAELETRLAAKVEAAITERILREARADEQIAEALAAIVRPDAATLRAGIQHLFEDEPEAEWRDHVETVTNELSDNNDQE
jgi:hypothetical protein